MSRKIVRLTLDHLDALPEPCRSCLFWELDPVRRERVEDPRGEKDAWLSQVLREWGSCGRVALVDDRPVGYLVYAPEAFVPGAASFPTAPVSPDAVLLTNVYVEPAHAGGGLGRMLVQGMARDLIERGGIKAVEAFGDTRGVRSCVAPVEFLGSVDEWRTRGLDRLDHRTGRYGIGRHRAGHHRRGHHRPGPGAGRRPLARAGRLAALGPAGGRGAAGHRARGRRA